MGTGLQKACPGIYDAIIIVASKAAVGIKVSGARAAIRPPPEVGHWIGQKRSSWLSGNHSLAKLIDDAQVVHGKPRRVQGLVPPLAPSAAIHDRAFLFIRARCR
jgi:hypothetical protein